MKKHGDQEDTYDVTQEKFKNRLLEHQVQSTVNVDKRTSESLNKIGTRWKVMRLDSCGHFRLVTGLSGDLTSVRLEKSNNVKERPNKVAKRLHNVGRKGVFAFALDGSQGADEPQADRAGTPAAASRGDALETPGVPASDPSRARGYSTPGNDQGKTSNTGSDDRTEGNPLDDVQIVSDSVVKVRPTLDAQLLSAASNGRWEKANDLIDRGAVNGVINDHGLTASMLAAGSDQTNIVMRLTSDTNVDDADPNGRTVLMLAARFGHINTVNALVKRHNVDVDAVDGEGRTALMIAAANGHTDTVRALAVTHNANVDVVDQYGKTALKIAEEEGHTDTVDALLLEALKRRS
jgi:hypothetical protein